MESLGEKTARLTGQQFSLLADEGSKELIHKFVRRKIIDAGWAGLVEYIHRFFRFACAVLGLGGAAGLSYTAIKTGGDAVGENTIAIVIPGPRRVIDYVRAARRASATRVNKKAFTTSTKSVAAFRTAPLSLVALQLEGTDDTDWFIEQE